MTTVMQILWDHLFLTVEAATTMPTSSIRDSGKSQYKHSPASSTATLMLLHLPTSFLVDASYLSLSNIVFDLMSPTTGATSFYLKSARLYFNADNIWYWTKRPGLDTRQSFTVPAQFDVLTNPHLVRRCLSVTF